jgi:hypothetical protein
MKWNGKRWAAKKFHTIDENETDPSKELLDQEIERSLVVLKQLDHFAAKFFKKFRAQRALLARMCSFRIFLLGNTDSVLQ